MAPVMRGLSLALRVLTVVILVPIWSSAIEYPYSVVPGGVRADHVLARDECLYLGMRFGGELTWTDHCVRLKAGEKMAGTRRARCGNPTASHLPPGAKTLPPGLRFLVPVMEKPLPNIVAPPQTTLMELTWSPPGELTPPTSAPPGQTMVHVLPLPYFFLPFWAVAPPPPCKHKPCKSPHPPLTTPEPSGVWLLLSGMAGLAVLIGLNHRRSGTGIALSPRTRKRNPRGQIFNKHSPTA